MSAAVVSAPLPARPTLRSAVPEPDQGIDATINEWFSTISEPVANTIFYSVPVAGADLPLIVLWLVVAAAFFTVYLGFLNVRGSAMPSPSCAVSTRNPNDAGEVSHFQALATAVSGTVGLGNIAGVAVAITLGGPGATFWMIVAGFLGMSTKLIECTLGVKDRRENADGSVSGAPMYHLRRGLAERGLAPLGAAATCSRRTRRPPRSSRSPAATTRRSRGAASSSASPSPSWWGRHQRRDPQHRQGDRQARPVHGGLYLTAALTVIAFNAEAVPAAFGAIVAGAFTPEGVTGGVVGVLIQGFRRAAFSNEAGIGSASIAHSAVRTKEPATEGYVALLEPFIDTVVICTMTALVIVITGVYTSGEVRASP